MLDLNILHCALRINGSVCKVITSPILRGRPDDGSQTLVITNGRELRPLLGDGAHLRFSLGEPLQLLQRPDGTTGAPAGPQPYISPSRFWGGFWEGYSGSVILVERERLLRLHSDNSVQVLMGLPGRAMVPDGKGALYYVREGKMVYKMQVPASWREDAAASPTSAIGDTGPQAQQKEPEEQLLFTAPAHLTGLRYDPASNSLIFSTTKAVYRFPLQDQEGQQPQQQEGLQETGGDAAVAGGPQSAGAAAAAAGRVPVLLAGAEDLDIVEDGEDEDDEDGDDPDYQPSGDSSDADEDEDEENSGSEDEDQDAAAQMLLDEQEEAKKELEELAAERAQQVVVVPNVDEVMAADAADLRRFKEIMGLVVDGKGKVLVLEERECEDGQYIGLLKHISPAGEVTLITSLPPTCYPLGVLPNGCLVLTCGSYLLLLDLGLKLHFNAGPHAAPGLHHILRPHTLAADLGALLDRQPNDNTADIRIQVGDTCFTAHRGILAARSEFFRRLLDGEWASVGARTTGSNQPPQQQHHHQQQILVTLPLPEACPEAFRQVLRYLYTGGPVEVQGGMVEAMRLAELAERLLLPELSRWAQEVVRAGVGVDTVLDALLWADKHGGSGGSFAKLRSSLKEWYLAHAEEVAERARDSLRRLAAANPDLMVELVVALRGPKQGR